MLEKAKLYYFSKIVFDCLDEKIKLKIVKYNKKMQSYINISQINYRLFSGKQIIYETKRKGKEYLKLKEEIIYEGEFLYGERNGKGKEYSTFGKLIFEGEFIKGKRNGKCKEFYYNKSGLKYEGEYLDGKKNGKGKEYYYEGKLLFEGEYLNGKRIKGKYYDKNENMIYKLNNSNGFGREYYSSGKILFEGEYLNGRRNGKGKEYFEDGKLKFEGDYLKGEKNGKGKEFVNDKIRFNGKYINGLKWDGKGYDENNNVIYELKNGKGFIKEYDFNNKLVFEGEYIDGKRNGKGREYILYL